MTGSAPLTTPASRAPDPSLSAARVEHKSLGWNQLAFPLGTCAGHSVFHQKCISFSIYSVPFAVKTSAGAHFQRELLFLACNIQYTVDVVRKP